MAYQPHPFHWVPASGRRHASRSRVDDGATARMLCGEHVVASYSDTAWLWETCASCNITAHGLAGVPMPTGAAVGA
ncbi:zinc finger protein [Saccharopolyspora flava]|uniref:zinc finger protein n=1 Tax=Saccharopolyspora flava TaxID=95161 RepID=UPI000B810F53|nr:zinc finger protein [Saccharopolyspora flava]